MEKNFDSDLTQYGIDKVAAYEQINADTLKQGELKLSQVIQGNLPPLSKLETFRSTREGSTAETYLFNQDGHKFLVKKLDLTKYESDRNSDQDTLFNQKIEEQTRAEKYFQSYIPYTVYIKRKSPETDQTEYLIVQDLLEGEQYRGDIQDTNGFYVEEITKQQEISNSLKFQLEDIIRRSWDMFKETGHSLDFDFILDKEHEKVWIFDTDSQFDEPIFIFAARYLKKLYGINLTGDVAHYVSKFTDL